MHKRLNNINNSNTKKLLLQFKKMSNIQRFVESW